MNLSTFRSNGTTILVLFLATVFSGWFSYRQKCVSHVESQYFGKARSISREYAKRFEKSGTGRYIIFGGSTVRTSYMPSLFYEEFEIPLVNQGLHAGFGDLVLTQMAIDEVNPGDVLIVSLEPSFLCQSGNEAPVPAGGRDFFISQYGLDFSKKPFFALDWTDAIQSLQGNTRYKCFMLMKRIRNMKPYRYVASENLHSDGWMEVLERRPFSYPSVQPTIVSVPRLSKHGRQLLTSIQKEATRRGSTVMYAIPPRFSPWNESRSSMGPLLLDISEIMPVVKDPLLGSNTNRLQFTDTPQHPDRDGAILASRSLGQALVSKAFWSKEELTSISENRNMDASTVNSTESK